MGQGLGLGLRLPVQTVRQDLDRGLGFLKLVGQQAVRVSQTCQLLAQVAQGRAAGDHVVDAEGEAQSAHEHRCARAPARLRPPEQGGEREGEEQVPPRQQDRHGFLHGLAHRGFL